ncbi:MAG: GlsB/YeaQ/YmgE family stress response membrane protein [Patescibacteria group bacterium]
MGIIWFLIIGVLAGWIAGELTRGNGFGLLGNLIVGIVGALLGGFLFDLLDISTYGGLLSQLLMSVIGAVSFLFILSFFGGVRREIR